MKLADRMSRLGTESAFEVLDMARAQEARGRSVIHLELGEPDFPTPDHIVEAGTRAIRDGFTRYCPAPGLPEMREAAVEFFARTRGVETSPDRIIVTPGSKPIMLYAIMATCQQGDEVVYPDPGFPMYESLAAFSGAKPVPVPLREENGFRVDPDELASVITDRTRMVLLNSPHNPCGSAMTGDDVRRIAEAVADRDLYVLSDEMYWAIRYSGEHQSIAALEGVADRTILLDGCSKTFAMTGWRLGFASVPQGLVEPMTKMVINSVSCTAAFTQKAAVAALTGSMEPVERMVEAFKERRGVVTAGLNRMEGITCTEPDGAFYVFPRVAELGGTGRDLVEHLLERAGVATLWGSAFGPGGEGYLRISYANSVENIRAALEAIEAALPSYSG